MATSNRMPFSGDNTQSINPWTWSSVFRSMGSQIGLVNIFMGRTSKPELEQQILDEVGSYGKQLGRIGDALEVLIKHVKIEKPTKRETTMLYLLQEQIDAISKIKKSRLLDKND
ncbi:MAG: hypothetical protein WC464_09035 [Bdellovibrionales bacterium]